MRASFLGPRLVEPISYFQEELMVKAEAEYVGVGGRWGEIQEVKRH